MAYNGGLVETTAEHPLFSRTLNLDDYFAIEDVARRNDTVICLTSPRYLYTSVADFNQYQMLESYKTCLPIRHRTLDQLVTMTDPLTVIKAMVMDDPQKVDRLQRALPSKLADRDTILRSEDYCLEFINREASKEHGLTVLAKQLGIPQAAVMAIGNGENDIGMIQWAGTGVAMANSGAAVKTAADVVTIADNNHDGVAEAVASILK